MQQQGSHFKVVHSEVSIRVACGAEALGDVLWPLHSPDNRMETLFAAQPDPSSAMFAGITEANEVRPAGDKLAALGGSAGNQFDSSQEVSECRMGSRASWEGDPCCAACFEGCVLGEKAVKGAEESLSIGNCQAGMLEFAQDGLEVLEGGTVLTENFLGCQSVFLQLAWGEFNGAMDAIKDPPQNFFPEGPNSFPCMQLLETDWFRVRVGVRVWGSWEDGVHCM